VFEVKIVWKLGQDTEEWWNQACAWVIEEFGLPGSCYNIKFTEDYMIFDFDNKEDAATMMLRWGKN